jgi:general stress protein YciG
MDPIKLKEIASMGGKAAQANGNGHHWNTTTAKIAGRKGGLTKHARSKKGRGSSSIQRDEREFNIINND